MSRKTSYEEKPLRATPGDYDRFVKSTIWYDISETVKDRVEYLQAQFLTATDAAEIRNLQGQMKAWKEMLGLPTYLKLCTHKEQHANQTEIDYGPEEKDSN